MDYALPNARWRYHGTSYENDDVAKRLLPLLLRQCQVWLGSDAARWGFGNSIGFFQNKDMISGISCHYSNDVAISWILIFALETVIFAKEIAKNEQEVSLDFLDTPLSLLERQGKA